MDKDFWKKKSLCEMSQEEWESICDGCGKCCLHKAEDEDGNVYDLNVGCKLLCNKSATCKDYVNRKNIVPDCIKLDIDSLKDINWLPDSCSYVLLANGESLPEWHHLITGDKMSVVKTGNSVAGKFKDEKEIDDIEQYAIDYLNNIL